MYILVGVIMFFLMRAIGEMMYRDPSQHTFINFITRYLGNGGGISPAGRIGPRSCCWA